MNKFTRKELLSENINNIILNKDYILKDNTILKKGFKLNINIEISKYNVESIWDDLCKLDTYNVNEKLNLDFNNNPKWLSGSHPNLNYRGRSINRTKLWCQEDTDGILIYNYTGFQYAVAQATFNIKKIKKIYDLANEMKKKTNGNHWIVTKYKNHNDSIGLHSDKMKNWYANSSFHVVKFGVPRRFLVVLNDKNETVLFDMYLPQGTSIIMDMFTNKITKHGVPKNENECGESGSIVSRFIKTKLSIEKFNKKLYQSELNKKKRKEKKISLTGGK